MDIGVLVRTGRVREDEDVDFLGTWSVVILYFNDYSKRDRIQEADSEHCDLGWLKPPTSLDASRELGPKWELVLP
jgi:hypothetical protein